MSLTTSPASLRLAPSASQGTPTTLVVPGGPATQPGNGMTLGPAVSGVNTTVPQSPAPGTLAGAVLGAHRTTQAGGTGGTDSDSEDEDPAVVTFHVRKPDPAPDLQDALQAFAPGDAKAQVLPAPNQNRLYLRAATQALQSLLGGLRHAKAKEAEFQPLPDDVMRIVGAYAQTRLPGSLRKFSGLMALPAPEDLKNLKQLTRVNEPTWVLASHPIKDTEWRVTPALCDPMPALCIWHDRKGIETGTVLLFEANLANFERKYNLGRYCQTPDFQGKFVIDFESSNHTKLWADPDAPTGKPAIEFASFKDFFKDFDPGKPQDVLVRCSAPTNLDFVWRGEFYHGIVPHKIDLHRQTVWCKHLQKRSDYPMDLRIGFWGPEKDLMAWQFSDDVRFAKSPFPRRIETPIQQAPEETPKPRPPDIKPLTPAEVRSIRAVGMGGTFTIADAYVTIISREDGLDGGELVGLHAATASDYLLHLSGATMHPEKIHRGYLYKIPLPKTEA